MAAKERTTVYLPADVLQEAKRLGVNVSQAAEAGLIRAIKKAALMAEAEKRIDAELEKMEA